MMQHRFHNPTSVAAATALLASEPDAKLIAGGATLVAMMNARLVEPSMLVSIAGIPEIRGIDASQGGARIGAFTRHRETAAHAGFDGTHAVLRDAAGQIANAVVRNMGTIGGSVAFADPGLDYPPALVALNAEFELASNRGTRRVPADAFFLDWYTTALAREEMIVAVILPAKQRGVGLYHKLARVSGDYATASVALTMTQDRKTRVAIGACGPKPILLAEANTLLSGDPDAASIRRAGELLQAAADPTDDVRGSADYRRRVIPRMVARAVHEARARIGGSA